MEREISSIAALLSESARAAMLVALLDGRALPAGELARSAGISAQSASNHLTLRQSMLQVEQQGRHRYYRLHRPEVAEAIEALACIAPPPQPNRICTPADPAVCFARHCYRHLAGRLAVQIFERFEAKRFFRPLDQKSAELTTEGREWFQKLGLDARLLNNSSDKLALRCLDWTERKHHLAGRLGVAFFHRLLEVGWLKPVRNSRAMRVTNLGYSELEKRLELSIPFRS